MISILNRSCRACLSLQTSIGSLAAVGSLSSLSSKFLDRKRDMYKRVMPKGWHSAFSEFLRTKENWTPGVSSKTELGRLMGLWKSLSEEERQPYQLAAQKRKEMFTEHLEDATRDLTNQELLERVVKELSLTSDTRHRVNALDRLAGKARRLPWNPYSLFVQDHHYVDGKKGTEDDYEKKLGKPSIARSMRGRAKLMGRNQELSEKWRTLPQEEKEAYRRRYQALVREKDSEYAEYLTQPNEGRAAETGKRKKKSAVLK